MVICDADHLGSLLAISYGHRVTVADVKGCLDEIRLLSERLVPGFLLFVDMSTLEKIDPDCVKEIAAIMDLCNSRGIAQVVRVLPDRRKDIGLNILSHFHYDETVQTRTFEGLAQAIKSLMVESPTIKTPDMAREDTGGSK